MGDEAFVFKEDDESSTLVMRSHGRKRISLNRSSEPISA